MHPIGLITKTRTTNIGNTTLSTVLLDLMEPAGVVQVDSLPSAVATRITRSDPDRWAARTSAVVGAPTAAGASESRPVVASTSLPPSLAEVEGHSTAVDLLQRAGRSPAGVAVRARLERAAARQALGRLLAPANLSWNPGGEFFSGSYPTRHLLSLTLRLEQGLPAGLVNFSFEPSPETAEWFRRFGPALDHVYVRDEASAERLAGLGIDGVVVCPDAVCVASEVLPAYRGGRRPGERRRMALIVHNYGGSAHGGDDGELRRWFGLADDLLAADVDVSIASSHYEQDGRFLQAARAFAAERPRVAVEDAFATPDAFVTYLLGLDGVVTSRFHPAVLAAAGGVPMIGVDGYGAKVSGGLSAMGLGHRALPSVPVVGEALELLEAWTDGDAAAVESAQATVREVIPSLVDVRARPALRRSAMATSPTRTEIDGGGGTSQPVLQWVPGQAAADTVDNRGKAFRTAQSAAYAALGALPGDTRDRAYLRLRNTYRSVSRGGTTVAGSASDLRRFLRHSWVLTDPSSDDHTRYFLRMRYHSFEKGLSLSEPRHGFGAGYILILLAALDRHIETNGYDALTNTVLSVLDEYDGYNQAAGVESPHGLAERLEQYRLDGWDSSVAAGGTFQKTRDQILEAASVDFRSFAFNRHSIRHFGPGEIDESVLVEAIEIAQRAPSVCNRQAARVHVFNGTDNAQRLLRHHEGHRGFGHQVPCAIAITADLRGYYKPGERFESWVDGGLFAMSLVFALHAAGLGTCFLNWNTSLSQDKELRRAIGLPDHETVITLLAVGQLPEDLRVAQSPRRPVDEVAEFHRG